MKKQFIKDDFGPLADKGWSQLSEMLNKELPVTAVPKRQSPFWKIAAACGIISILGLTFGLLKKTGPTRSVAILAPIETHFSFTIPAPVLSIDRPIIVQRTIHVIAESVDKKTILRTMPSFEMKPESMLSIKEKAWLVAQSLPLYQEKLQIHQLPVSIYTTQKSVSTLIKERILPKIGVNLNSSANGTVLGAGVGGGLSVLFPVTEKFSIEPGVGYGLMRYNNNAMVEGHYRSAPAPQQDLRYRLQQSLELPLSFHYMPINQLAFTGGINIDLLISQKMVFAENENGLSGSAYAKQLNDSELNQLNRLNFGAHGGISWFPTTNWKLGVYVGQNLTNRLKVESSNKLKISNQTYKLRMAHYF